MIHARFPLLFATALASAAALPARAVDIDAAARSVRDSLVLVEWHYRDENQSREEVGQGIVVGKDTVLVWGGLISENIPRDYIRDIKIRQPRKNFARVNATFLGRTQNRLFAYLKAKAPLDAVPLSLKDATAPKLGQRVFSVAILDKAGGYDTHVGGSQVRLLQTRTYATATVSDFGLTRANSPVFDADSGALLGLTLPSQGDDFYLRTTSGLSHIQLYSEQQSGTFLPWEEIKDYLTNVPAAPFDLPRAWTGVGGLAGVDEQLRELYQLQQTTGVSVGSVVPGTAADKAGLKPRDIIITVNGKPVSDSPVPDVMRTHFQRYVEHAKPGDVLQLGVLRPEPGRAGEELKPLQIALRLEASPKNASELPHVLEAKVGVVTRDLNFWDLYNRKLAQDTKGVVVATVKNGSPASIGSTPLKAGYIITKVNDTNIENQRQFNDVMKKESADPEKKEFVFVVLQGDGESKVCRIDVAK